MQQPPDEVVISLRRLAHERYSLPMELSTPLDDFEYVAISTVHDEFSPDQQCVGPLRHYLLFFDRSGAAIPMAFFDCDDMADVQRLILGLGLPTEGWTRCGVVLDPEARSLPPFASELV